MKITQILKIILLVLISQKSIFSQKKVEFHYLINGRINNHLELPIWGMEQEFNTYRTYYKTSLFSETRLFTGDSTKATLFKIRDGIWYYNFKNKWNLFYDSKRKVGGRYSIMNVKYKILFKQEINVNNIYLHKIELEPLSLIQSHKLFYYFSPKKGILIVKAGSSILLRTDCFEKDLDEKDINLL